MATLTNSYESGLSSGTAISTSNSGASDTQWSSVSTTIGTAKYDSSFALRGSLSGQYQTTGLSGSPYTAWTSGISATTTYCRLYVLLPSSLSSNIVVATMMSSITNVASIRLNSAGTVTLLWNGTTGSVTSSTTLSTGQWYRLEMVATAGTGTNGSASLRIYTSPDSATIAEQKDSGATNTGTASAITILRVGMPTGASNTTVNIDDVGFTDTTWLGASLPVLVPPIVGQYSSLF